MKRFRNHFSLYVCLTLTLFITTLSSCKKETKEEEKPAPPATPTAPPPDETMVMNFNDFDKSNGRLGMFPSDTNWNRAAFTVGVWSFIVAINMVIPVAAFRESFKYQAVYQESTKEWVWSYNFTPSGGVLHTAKLQASLDGSYINWNMYISKQNSFQNVLWYSGKSKTDNLEGTWSINKDPLAPKKFVDIEWRRNPTTKTWDIKYTNAIPGDPGNGGYIHHGIVKDSIHDAYFNIFYKQQNNLVNIKWNRATKEGRMKDSVLYKDILWHCWDNLKKNKNCN